MNLTIKDLPESLKQIAEDSSLGDVLLLVEYYGGNRIYVPLEKTEQRFPLLSKSAREALLKNHGGEIISIPNLKKLRGIDRNKSIVDDYKRQGKVSDLVRKYGLTERRIRDIIKVSVVS